MSVWPPVADQYGCIELGRYVYCFDFHYGLVEAYSAGVAPSPSRLITWMSDPIDNDYNRERLPKGFYEYVAEIPKAQLYDSEDLFKHSISGYNLERWDNVVDRQGRKFLCIVEWLGQLNVPPDPYLNAYVARCKQMAEHYAANSRDGAYALAGAGSVFARVLHPSYDGVEFDNAHPLGQLTRVSLLFED